MPVDDRLILLLRTLQVYDDEEQDVTRLFPTASYLLSTLSNPLNLAVLTAQLLDAPAIWMNPRELQTCLHFMGLFQSAATTILRYEEKARTDISSYRPTNAQTVFGGNLSRDVWVTSVVKGADERSQQWKHVLVIGGLILGYGGAQPNGLSRSLRSTLEGAFIKALNVALIDVRYGEDIGASTVTLALNYVFPVLSATAQSQIEYDLLLPVIIGSAFFSRDGYQSCSFLENLDQDVVQVSASKFAWPDRSGSYLRISSISSKPLVTGMGPLSRLIAHAIENSKDPWLVPAVVDDMSDFAKTLIDLWRQIKLSEVALSDEKTYFDDATLKSTLPMLWKLLRSSLFAVVIVLRACLGRVVGHSSLGDDQVAPTLAKQTLVILRDLYFVSSRLGESSFSQYRFIYLTSIDILSAYSEHSQSFVQSITPPGLGQIPSHPLDRISHLYFLNTVEHFTLVLAPHTCENLLIPAALPYIVAGVDPHLLDISEAAHSVMLSIFSSPHYADIAGRHLPFYVEALFSAYPRNLSSQQFRLAFKTLLRITTPPAPLFLTNSDLPESLLEFVQYRAIQCGSHKTIQIVSASADGGEAPDEATTLVLTLIDSLPLLPSMILEEYLRSTAEVIAHLQHQGQRQQCRDRFWEVLSNGEMDIDRSHICLGWWTTRGGRETVMFDGNGPANSGQNNVFLMSGALQHDEDRNIDAKL